MSLDFKVDGGCGAHYAFCSRERVRTDMDEETREAFSLLNIDKEDVEGSPPEKVDFSKERFFPHHDDGDEGSLTKLSGVGLKKWENSQQIVPWLKSRVHLCTGSVLSELEMHAKFVEDLGFEIDQDAFFHGLRVFSFVEGVRILWDDSSNGEKYEAKIENVAWKNDAEDYSHPVIDQFNLEEFSKDVLAMEMPYECMQLGKYSDDEV